MKKINDLKIKIFADGANKQSMFDMNAKPYIQGLTTNPSLMRQAGITNYKAFALEILDEIKIKPISFEVFADDFIEMERQAMEIAAWGDNVYVKIPVMNTKKETAYSLIHTLSKRGVKLNITALMSLDQVQNVAKMIQPNIPSIVSVFAGRIADTGRDPVPLMRRALELLKNCPAAELLWASSRELINIFQADEIGCPIITATPDILKKLSLVGYDLEAYSLDTVQMFYQDACAAGFSL